MDMLEILKIFWVYSASACSNASVSAMAPCVFNAALEQSVRCHKICKGSGVRKEVNCSIEWD